MTIKRPDLHTAVIEYVKTYIGRVRTTRTGPARPTPRVVSRGTAPARHRCMPTSAQLLPFLATLLVPVTVAAQPAAAPTEAVGGPATGVAVELRLETGDYLIDDDLALPVTDAGLFVGYQMSRVTVGLGLDFGRISESRPSDTGGDSSAATTTFVIMPGARFTVARTADGRAELIAAADVGFGQTSFSFDSPDFPDPDPEPTSRLRVQAGPGLRYWVSPAFAFGATTGLRYERMSRDREGGSMSLSNTALYTSLHMTGVF